MSSGLNKVMLFGRLGADPEYRATQNGQVVLKLRLATNECYYDRSNNLVEKTEWHSVTVFGARAEALGKILAKGDALFVDGSIRNSSYEKDGITRYRSEVVARDIILGGKNRRVTPAAAASSESVEMMEDPFADLDTPAVAAEPASDNVPFTATTAAPVADPIATVEPAAVEATRKRRRDNGYSRAEEAAF